MDASAKAAFVPTGTIVVVACCLTAAAFLAFATASSAAARPCDVDHGVVEDELWAGGVSRAVTLLRIGAPGEGSLDGRR